jgi:hypothetical protein
MPCRFQEAVAHAIDSSELDIVQRLPVDAKAKLVQDISSVATRARLYGTQLEAFSRALSCSVHCTQGPPGTGKVRDTRL